MTGEEVSSNRVKYDDIKNILSSHSEGMESTEIKDFINTIYQKAQKAADVKRDAEGNISSTPIKPSDLHELISSTERHIDHNKINHITAAQKGIVKNLKDLSENSANRIAIAAARDDLLVRLKMQIEDFLFRLFLVKEHL